MMSVLQSLKGVSLNTERFPAVKLLCLCHPVYTLSIRPHTARFVISFLSRKPPHSLPPVLAQFPRSLSQRLCLIGQRSRLIYLPKVSLLISLLSVGRNHHSCVCLITMETVSGPVQSGSGM